jgi:hypothetical protein
MSTRLHENPLIAATKAMIRSRDKAEGKGEKPTGARLILSKISANDILDKYDTIFASARNTLIRPDGNGFIAGLIAPQIKTVFLQARVNAWNIAIRTPGGSVSASELAFVRKHKRVINDTEKAYIIKRLEPQVLKLQAANKAIINNLIVSIRNMESSGMAKESIRETIARDWINGGRITGIYQREFIATAREIIGIADKAGQVAGFYDIGNWVEVI